MFWERVLVILSYWNDDVYRFHASALYFFSDFYMLFSNIQIILYLKYVRKMLTFWIIEYFCKFCKCARVLREKFQKKKNIFWTIVTLVKILFDVILNFKYSTYERKLFFS